eukprot:1379659-Rhodomonas_salina.1
MHRTIKHNIERVSEMFSSGSALGGSHAKSAAPLPLSRAELSLFSPSSSVPFRLLCLSLSRLFFFPKPHLHSPRPHLPRSLAGEHEAPACGTAGLEWSSVSETAAPAQSPNTQHFRRVELFLPEVE